MHQNRVTTRMRRTQNQSLKLMRKNWQRSRAVTTKVLTAILMVEVMTVALTLVVGMMKVMKVSPVC